MASVLNRPDLVVEKMVFSIIPNPARKGDDVSVEYTIANLSQTPTRDRPTAAGRSYWASHPASNGLFDVSILGRTLPNGTFVRMAGNQIELGASGRITIGTVEFVPTGTKREYKVKADYYDWIDELNESNNERTIVWPPGPM